MSLNICGLHLNTSAHADRTKGAWEHILQQMSLAITMATRSRSQTQLVMKESYKYFNTNNLPPDLCSLDSAFKIENN